MARAALAIASVFRETGFPRGGQGPGLRCHPTRPGLDVEDFLETRNASRRTNPRLPGPLHDTFLDRRALHDLDARGILKLRSDHEHTQHVFVLRSFMMNTPLVGRSITRATFQTFRPCVAPRLSTHQCPPTEVKVTLIQPPGKAVKGKSPDALVYPVRAQQNALLLL